MCDMSITLTQAAERSNQTGLEKRLRHVLIEQGYDANGLTEEALRTLCNGHAELVEQLMAKAQHRRCEGQAVQQTHADPDRKHVAAAWQEFRAEQDALSRLAERGRSEAMQRARQAAEQSAAAGRALLARSLAGHCEVAAQHLGKVEGCVRADAEAYRQITSPSGAADATAGDQVAALLRDAQSRLEATLQHLQDTGKVESLVVPSQGDGLPTLEDVGQLAGAAGLQQRLQAACRERGGLLSHGPAELVEGLTAALRLEERLLLKEASSRSAAGAGAQNAVPSCTSPPCTAGGGAAQMMCSHGPLEEQKQKQRHSSIRSELAAWQRLHASRHMEAQRALEAAGVAREDARRLRQQLASRHGEQAAEAAERLAALSGVRASLATAVQQLAMVDREAAAADEAFEDLRRQRAEIDSFRGKDLATDALVNGLRSFSSALTSALASGLLPALCRELAIEAPSAAEAAAGACGLAREALRDQAAALEGLDAAVAIELLGARQQQHHPGGHGNTDVAAVAAAALQLLDAHDTACAAAVTAAPTSGLAPAGGGGGGGGSGGGGGGGGGGGQGWQLLLGEACSRDASAPLWGAARLLHEETKVRAAAEARQQGARDAEAAAQRAVQRAQRAAEQVGAAGRAAEEFDAWCSDECLPRAQQALEYVQGQLAFARGDAAEVLQEWWKQPASDAVPWVKVDGKNAAEWQQHVMASVDF